MDNIVFKYLSKVLYILGDGKKDLVGLLFLFTIASLVETLGVGLIGPFLNLSSNPQVIHETPWIQFVYQQLGVESNSKFIFLLGIVIIGAFCIKSLLYFLARVFIIKFSFAQTRELIAKLLNTYLTVPYTFHIKRNTADLIKNIILETQHFTHYCLMPLLNCVANMIVALVLLLLLAKTDLLLLSMMLGVIFPIFILFQSLGKRFGKWGQVLSETNQEMIRIINHSLGGVKETRIIGCESYFEDQMKQQTLLHSRAATFFWGSEMLPRILIETFLIIFIILFISITHLVSSGSTKDLTSVLAVFAVGSIRLIPSTSQFVQGIGHMRSHTYSLNMLYHDLKEIENTDKGNGQLNNNSSAQDIMSFQNKVELNHITYTYPESSEPSIKNISLTIEKGKSIALIGKSGAGKTTLVDVILGLLDPNDGDILVDGISVYNNLRAWQNLIGYIPQSISLMDDTVERNIAFGVPDHLIDQAKLNKAIKAAQLEELLEQLPQGINTFVGERGVRLSGGQRQRIGIARALYFEREILVLDEATSALDSETEALVTEAIRSLSGTKTMIIIAHRLSTVEHCDRVYMLEKGTVVKSGNFNEVVVSR